MRDSAKAGRYDGKGQSNNKGATVKRSRGRGRRPQNNTNRTFDSTGPEIKIRGSASHVYEKYLQLARDANSAGDRVAAENYLQHAEHYYRIISAMQPPPGANNGNGAVAGKPNGNGNGADTAPSGSGPSFSLIDEGEDDEGDIAE
ncbi:MAG: DUF4167 domain-containing protein [Pseudomonadota bacterium]|nr:DUF4167 domain-containing protein [Pseudomonadota bacterium]